MMEKLEYKLEETEFQGPLDLLLHLISKNKLNIYDIQISEILEQYMSYINKMDEDEMESCSEFLEMAARLVYIKTVSLLPKYEEYEDFKRELEGQLIEYKECKRIAYLLAGIISFDSFRRIPSEIDVDMEYKRNHSKDEIARAYLRVVGEKNRKLPPIKESFSKIVSTKIISVNSKIVHILRKLWKMNVLEYNEIFESSKERSEVVATFLALLELVKGKRVSVEEIDSSIILKLINGGNKNEH